MNYLHLRAFHAVATHGSFTRAAAALHVTQAAQRTVNQYFVSRR